MSPAAIGGHRCGRDCFKFDEYVANTPLNDADHVGFLISAFQIFDLRGFLFYARKSSWNK